MCCRSYFTVNGKPQLVSIRTAGEMANMDLRSAQGEELNSQLYFALDTGFGSQLMP